MKHLFAAISAMMQVYILFPLTAKAEVETGLEGATNNLSNVGDAYGETTPSATQLPTLIGNLINVVLGFMGIFLVVYIVWAGYIYTSSQGDKEKIDKAKKMISSAVVGLILIVAAYAISAYVLEALITASEV